MGHEILPTIQIGAIDSNLKAQDLADAIITALKSGHVDPLDFVVRRKFIEKAFDDVMGNAEVKSIVSDMLDKHPMGKAFALGAEISQGTRTTMEYKENHQWLRLDAERKSLEESIKAATKTGGDLIDPESGEVIASPVSTKTTSYFTVKLPK